MSCNVLYLGFIITLIATLLGCQKPAEKIFDGNKSITINLNNRIFLVPKKYIDSPNKSVETPLIFDRNGSMIAYFYWPSLKGLTNLDEQQYFGRFNHDVVQMQWFLLNQQPVSTKSAIENSRKRTDGVKKCIAKNVLLCEQLEDTDFYLLVGKIEANDSFYIRCPRENEKILENSICNFTFDFEQNNLYVEGLISSQFVEGGQHVDILHQVRSFLVQWEQK